MSNTCIKCQKEQLSCAEMNLSLSLFFLFQFMHSSSRLAFKYINSILRTYYFKNLNRTPLLLTYKTKENMNKPFRLPSLFSGSAHIYGSLQTTGKLPGALLFLVSFSKHILSLFTLGSSVSIHASGFLLLNFLGWVLSSSSLPFHVLKKSTY